MRNRHPDSSKTPRRIDSNEYYQALSRRLREQDDEWEETQRALQEIEDSRILLPREFVEAMLATPLPDPEYLTTSHRSTRG